MRISVFGMCGLLLLAGCGGDDGSAADAEQSSVEGSSSSDTEVASGEGGAGCESVEGETAPEGQPADDILGVREGMSIEQTRQVLQCRNASYAIRTSDYKPSLPDGGQMSRVDLTADSGLDRVVVWLVGPSGEEQVMHVERTIEFTSGNELPIASIEQELENKYGEFDAAAYGHSGYIVRSRDGQRLGPNNTNYTVCRRHTFSSESPKPCFNVVSYDIQDSSDNAQLASKFTVTITNQARNWAMVEAAQGKKASEVEHAREKAEDQGLEL